jgi:hypothetical protein
MRSERWRLGQIAEGIVVMAALLVAIGTAVAQEKPFSQLDQQLQPLKNQFNADIGKVRILVIVDPT